MNAPANIDSATLYNIDLEQEVLGSVIVNNHSFEVIDSKLTGVDFFEPLHCRIFEAIRTVHASHGVITPVLIIASIGADAGQTIVEGVNLRQYIARLAAAASVPRNAPAYAKQIREFADRRKMLATAERYLSVFRTTSRRPISRALQWRRWTKSLPPPPPDPRRRYP
jgi:replicative DNA helicase